MSRDFVRPDRLFPMQYGEGQRLMVSAKWDTIHHIPQLGEYILKVFDDEDGIISYYLDSEQDALNIVDYAGLPLIKREWITQSEYNACMEAKASRLNDDMFDFSEIDEEAIIAEFDEEE